MIGTLLLHVLVVHSIILGTRAPKVRPPDAQGPGATFLESSAEPAEELILVPLPSVELRTQTLSEDLSSVGNAPPSVLATVISPDPLPHIDIPSDSSDENADTVAKVDSGDPARRALLFGRYSGQIQARIERAWRRPRLPVSEGVDRSRDPAAGDLGGSLLAEDSFRCQVRIIQDPHGAVQEVQMLSCNGGVTWQKSLVAAILSASPLPAPPSPTVFTPSITMTFEAQTYVAGSPSDEYDSD